MVLHEGGRLRIQANPGGVCPNGDRLLRSVAERLGKSGLGPCSPAWGGRGPGLAGHAQGGALTFVQEGGSCAVDGCPRRHGHGRPRAADLG